MSCFFSYHICLSCYIYLICHSSYYICINCFKCHNCLAIITVSVAITVLAVTLSQLSPYFIIIIVLPTNHFHLSSVCCQHILTIISAVTFVLTITTVIAVKTVSISTAISVNSLSQLSQILHCLTYVGVTTVLFPSVWADQIAAREIL